MARYTKTEIDNGKTFRDVNLMWHIEIDTDATPNPELIQAHTDFIQSGTITKEEAARVISVRSEFPTMHPRKG